MATAELDRVGPVYKAKNLVNLEDRLGNHDVFLNYYKDTGLIVIDVLGLENDDDCTLGVFNLSGMAVVKENIESMQTSVDISSFASGIYIIKVQLDGVQKSWKIIKK